MQETRGPSTMPAVVGCVLYEPTTWESLAQWVVEDVLRRHMQGRVDEILSRPVEGAADDPDAFLSAALAATRPADASPAACTVVLVIAVFWDGQSDSSKVAFIQLKRLRGIAAAGGLPGNTAGGTVVRVALQALNAKQGEHTMTAHRPALIASLEAKLVAAGAGEARASGGRPLEGAPPAETADVSVPALQAAVRAGQGETFVVLSAATREDLEARVGLLRSNAAAAELGLRAVLAEPRAVTRRVEGGPPERAVAQEFLLRQGAGAGPMELRLALCGNVDSGKSTLTSVLTRGGRDDGRGRARALVFNHPHEAATGRTSSVGESHLGFSAAGAVVNYDAPSSVGAAGGRHGLPSAFASRSAKVVTLYDLAGHERYLRTTVLGLTRSLPDYAGLVISANNGIQRMTKEHLVLCLALRLPFFIVLTRIDATPPNVRAETLASIHQLLKTPTVRRLPYPITSGEGSDEVLLAAKHLRHHRITPIFEVSNVTGEGLAELLSFLNLLPQRTDWVAARARPKEMIINSTFFVQGVGTVVGGVVTQGVFSVNDTVLLGPSGLGHFRPVTIKSIHVKGVDQARAEAGSDAAFCLKKEKRHGIQKGNVLVDPQGGVPEAAWQFEAEITILYHSTTIAADYEPVIHSTTVRQSARITYVAKDVLRTGDRSVVRFHFLYRPEFMREGQRLIFREGRTKGIGVVTQIIPHADPNFHGKASRSSRRAGEAPAATA